MFAIYKQSGTIAAMTLLLNKVLIAKLITATEINIGSSCNKLCN